MTFVIDTNILIEFSRGGLQNAEQSIFMRLVNYSKIHGHQLIVPSISIFEYFSGKEMNNQLNRQNATRLLSDVTIVDVTRAIAETAASLYRTHKASIGVIDYMLAATAISLDAELVTLNVKHFRLITDLRIFDQSKVG